MRPLASDMGEIGQMTIDDLSKLGVAEQVEALAAIWDRLAASNTLIPLTQLEKDLLDQRYAAEKSVPGKSWKQVRADIQAHFNRTPH